MNKRSASKCFCEIYGLKTNKKTELLVFTSKTFICFFMLPKCLSLPLSPTPPRQKSLITLVFSFNFLKTLQKLYTKTLNSAFSTVPKYADLALYSLNVEAPSSRYACSGSANTVHKSSSLACLAERRKLPIPLKP